MYGPSLFRSLWLMTVAAGNETGADLLRHSLAVRLNSADTLIHHDSAGRLLLLHTRALSPYQP